MHFKVLWIDYSTSWEVFTNLKEDAPKIAAQYIAEKEVKQLIYGGDYIFQWAKQILHYMKRAVRIITK